MGYHGKTDLSDEALYGTYIWRADHHCPTELRNRIMDAVNEKHGLKTEAQAIVCSLKADHFAPI